MFWQNRMGTFGNVSPRTHLREGEIEALFPKASRSLILFERQRRYSEIGERLLESLQTIANNVIELAKAEKPASAILIYCAIALCQTFANPDMKRPGGRLTARGPSIPLTTFGGFI